MFELRRLCVSLGSDGKKGQYDDLLTIMLIQQGSDHTDQALTDDEILDEVLMFYMVRVDACW
jgi:hypothetical protein